MKIAMVVFDMAGTTIDEDNIVYKTLQSSIQTFGIQVDLDKVLAVGAGQEKLNAIKDILSTFGNADDIQKSAAIFDHFKNQLASAYALFPIKAMKDAEDVLVSLRKKNIIVVLNTGYDKKTANFILNKINWNPSQQFDLLVTATDVENSRPAPDMIHFAMKSFSLEDPKQVIKVGDSKIDIEEGKNANCLFSIGITTGAQTKTQLLEASPDFIIDELSEIQRIVNLN